MNESFSALESHLYNVTFFKGIVQFNLYLVYFATDHHESQTC